MHPPETRFSVIWAIDGAQCVGEITDFFWTVRAALWDQPTTSWIDLNPPGAAFSNAYDVDEGVQVGRAFFPGIGVRAWLWRGASESGEDLHAYLPSQYVGSEARGVWVDGGVTYVAGFGANGTTGLKEAVLWISDACAGPTQAVYIPGGHRTVAGHPTLDIQDPNTPSAVTGYNVYRSSSRVPPPATWPLEASNVADEDAGSPGVQWTDASGDVSPTQIWYYQVTAHHSGCSVEGPF